MIMKKVFSLLLTVALLLTLACKDDDDKKEVDIDKNALILGSWKLTETNDPAGVPLSLIYTFSENGIFSASLTTRAGNRSKSIIDGTWRFVDQQQIQLEIVTVTAEVSTIEILNESTLKLKKDDISKVMTKQ
jgi:Lipocalin-like domain